MPQRAISWIMSRYFPTNWFQSDSRLWYQTALYTLVTINKITNLSQDKKPTTKRVTQASQEMSTLECLASCRRNENMTKIAECIPTMGCQSARPPKGRLSAPHGQRVHRTSFIDHCKQLVKVTTDELPSAGSRTALGYVHSLPIVTCTALHIWIVGSPDIITIIHSRRHLYVADAFQSQTVSINHSCY